MDVLESPARLAAARAAHRPGALVPHTVVVLPSYSVDTTLLARYGRNIPALEHRQLLAMLMLPRLPRGEMVFVTAKLPTPRVLEYYLSFVPEDRRSDTLARTHLLEVPDESPRSITAKLLDRPDLIARIGTMTRGRLAFIEPWNVTRLEMDVAQRLGLPLNGTPPELWPLGFKSNGRQIMRDAGVPLPAGREDVRTVPDVLSAAASIRQHHAGAAGMVIKLDNSSTGLGNRVVRFADSPTDAELLATVESLEPEYLARLASGGVVEELVAGPRFASPSVQVDIAPGHRVDVISTHEQLHGGLGGQEYLGCQFPARPDYRHHLTAYGEAIGKLLADRGAMGRFCVDFAAVGSPSSRWQVFGLEINVRRSGTSHPFSLLENLVPGGYDRDAGVWAATDGSQRCYHSTDSLADPAWQGRSASDVIDAVRAAGLEFDPQAGVGAVLHSFIGLDIDGHLGLTTIGRSPAHAEHLHQAAVTAIGGSGIT